MGGGGEGEAVGQPSGWINKRHVSLPDSLSFWGVAKENCKWNEVEGWSELDDTVDPSVSIETTKLMGHGLDGIFTQCVCTEYEYAETPKHTHTHAHIHTDTHILMFAHTQDPWINSQALVWQGNTGNFRQLPLPACQTWGSRSVLVVFGYACLLCFICQSQLMLLYRKNFDRINALFSDFHPNNGNQWVHLMSCRESLYFWGKKTKNVSRHDVTGFLPKRGNCHSVKLKWNMFSTHYFCFAPWSTIQCCSFSLFLLSFLCFKKKKKRICLSNLPFIAGHWLIIPGECYAPRSQKYSLSSFQFPARDNKNSAKINL